MKNKPRRLLATTVAALIAVIFTGESATWALNGVKLRLGVVGDLGETPGTSRHKTGAINQNPNVVKLIGKVTAYDGGGLVHVTHEESFWGDVLYSRTLEAEYAEGGSGQLRSLTLTKKEMRPLSRETETRLTILVSGNAQDAENPANRIRSTPLDEESRVFHTKAPAKIRSVKELSPRQISKETLKEATEWLKILQTGRWSFGTTRADTPILTPYTGKYVVLSPDGRKKVLGVGLTQKEAEREADGKGYGDAIAFKVMHSQDGQHAVGRYPENVYLNSSVKSVVDMKEYTNLDMTPYIGRHVILSRDGRRVLGSGQTLKGSAQAALEKGWSDQHGIGLYVMLSHDGRVVGRSPEELEVPSTSADGKTRGYWEWYTRDRGSYTGNDFSDGLTHVIGKVLGVE